MPADHDTGQPADATAERRAAPREMPDSRDGTDLLVPRRPVGRPADWRRVLSICLVAFAVWLVLDAPTLQHNAQVSPVGIRRTVSLDVVGPIAAVSRGLGLGHVVSGLNSLLGRQGNRPGNGTALLPKRLPPKTTTTTTLPLPTATAPLRPNPHAELHVLVLGDSLGIDLGNALVPDLLGTGVVQATLDGQVGTGLTRPDYYDWPTELATDLPIDHPQLVVVMIGANDGQDFPGPPDVPYGSSEWNTMYAARVGSFMTEASSDGAQVLWVGMPPMQNPVLSAKMDNINSIVQRQAARHPRVAFVSSWTILGTPQGQFTPYLTTPGGEEVNVREPDGTHISPGGAEILSQALIAAFPHELHIELPR
jgi:lysophospholipase L1-like esterase